MVSHRDERLFLGGGTVLILIVMDNGLSLMAYRDEAIFGGGLNPYCNG